MKTFLDKIFLYLDQWSGVASTKAGLDVCIEFFV